MTRFPAVTPAGTAAGSDEILGFTAFGAEASELMVAVQTAMIGGVPFTTLRNGIFTHPTVGEGLTVLLSNPPPAPRPRSLRFSHTPDQWPSRGD